MSAAPVVAELESSTRARAEAFLKKSGRAPHLAVVLVGNNPASVIYTTSKGKKAGELGFTHETINLLENSKPEAVRDVIKGLNENPGVDGILLQRPLPADFREEEVVYWIDPSKDVDAFHPINVGNLALGLPSFAPCTPAGVMELLKFYNVTVSGKLACVIGRSAIVGKPMATLLLQQNATILHCHSKTPDLKAITQQADILVVAAGKMALIDSSYVKEGAYVVDVGIHRNALGKVCGDVIYDDVAKKAAGITPVPGGIGPMTIALLMKNTVLAAERRLFAV